MSKYLVFATASMALLLSAISGTAIAVAFPTIMSSFSASLILAGWVLSIYQLVATAGMPLAGKASDVFGRKSVFILCLSLFTLGSLLCAVAPNIELLIFFRLIQAIGGGGFLPSAAGIVADEFPHARPQAIGLFTSIFPIGQIIGPNLGGWMIAAYGWRSIFWLNIPFCILALVGSALLLRSEPRKAMQIDVAGAALLTGSLCTFMVGISVVGSGTGQLAQALVWLLFAASVAFIIAFIRRESKIKDPIIELEVLRQKPFVAANIYNFVFGACIFGFFSFVPLYAVSIYGMSVFQSGLILTPRSVGIMLASAVASIFLPRWGYRWPMLIGTAMVMLSLFLLGFESPGITIFGMQFSSTALLLVIMALSGLGMGMALPAANNACIELMPDRVATITGIRGMFRLSGGAIAIAIISLLLQRIGNMALGFSIVFFGLAVIVLITVPAIFGMPRTCETPLSVKDIGHDTD